jgi:ribosome maturation factor RimP
MISKENILSLIEEKLSDSEYFIVSLDVSTTNKIKLVIDSMKGITIEECVQFSRLIEHNLDREKEDFELEVASPGLTTPLQVREQYLKNVNRELDFYLKGDNKKISGKLLEVNDNDILVSEEKRMKVEGHKKKQLVKKEHRIEFNNINKALIVIKF